MTNIIRRIRAATIPELKLATEKREFEKYLRAQGWTRAEALKAVADKYREEAKQ